MAFSSVIGASSVIKPGVVTSSTRPSAPYNGQVVYETDTGNPLVYNGSAWVAFGGGLRYITQATPSAVQTISINNCFSSTYANYLILIDISAVSGAGALIGRMRLSGTDATTNYTGQRIGAQGSTAFGSTNPTGTDDWYFGAIDSVSPGSYASTINVFSPFLARPTVANVYSGGVETSGTLIQLIWNGHTTASAYDGITIFTTATNFTGTIRVYGYVNS